MVEDGVSYGDVLLKVEGVTKRLGDSLVLRDVNAEIRDVVRPGMTQGQVVALLGPSGMGKTTLFRILAGLEPSDSGRVCLQSECPVKRGDVGVVSQSYALFAHRTVLGNLIVAGRQAGLNRRDATAQSRELLSKFGLTDQASKYPTQLSGGQRQRVAIAQQIICSERLLLMDEPFSGLDPLAVSRVVGLINEIAAKHELMSFVIVTHDIGAAISVADTIWILGRDRNEAGNVVPGARIQKVFNLAELGVAWLKDAEESVECSSLRREIRALFPTL